MYVIKIDNEVVYTCTDQTRFECEAVSYASVRNATFWLNDQKLVLVAA